MQEPLSQGTYQGLTSAKEALVDASVDLTHVCDGRVGTELRIRRSWVGFTCQGRCPQKHLSLWSVYSLPASPLHPPYLSHEIKDDFTISCRDGHVTLAQPISAVFLAQSLGGRGSEDPGWVHCCLGKSSLSTRVGKECGHRPRTVSNWVRIEDPA